MTLELKKRHDLMRKRMEKVVKDKQESVSQLKSLFTLFTQQRKALEISVQKTKKLEEDNVALLAKNKQLEEQAAAHRKRCEQLEQDREMLVMKHRRDREQVEQEVEERRQQVRKQEAELKEVGTQKLVMKKQLDEYEVKVKKLILEFEEESKKHIRELNEVHEQYRGYKSASLDLESRIQHYKQEAQKSQEGERLAKKDLHRVRLENDELRERLRFVEGRYGQLVERCGASPEEAMREIEEEVKRGASMVGEDDEA